jgi:hypothetical protein
MLEIAGKFLEKLKPIDPLNIVKRMTDVNISEALIGIAKDNYRAAKI